MFKNLYEFLREPSRSPKCYEMTDDERKAAIVRLNRNVWNDPNLAKQDDYGQPKSFEVHK